MADDFNLMVRIEHCQVFPVIGQLHVMIFSHLLKGIGQSHVAEPVMMAVCFPVGGHMHQRRGGAAGRQGIEKSFRKGFRILQKSAKGQVMGDLAVIEKDRHGIAAGQPHQIGHGGVDGSVTDIAPDRGVERPDPPGLPGRENGEADAVFGENLQGIQVNRCFRQPHPLRGAVEMSAE